jgi:hypothetical protein
MTEADDVFSVDPLQPGEVPHWARVLATSPNATLFHDLEFLRDHLPVAHYPVSSAHNHGILRPGPGALMFPRRRLLVCRARPGRARQLRAWSMEGFIAQLRADCRSLQALKQPKTDWHVPFGDLLDGLRQHGQVGRLRAPILPRVR